MAAGSLQLNIDTLRSALSGVDTLLGDGETGLSAAALLDSPAEATDVIGNQLAGAMGGVFAFEGSEEVERIGAFFTDLSGRLDATPAAALETLSARIEAVDAGFAGDLPGLLSGMLTELDEVLAVLPENPAAVAQTLLDQVLELISRLNGTDASAIAAWAASLEAQLDALTPVLEALGEGDAPVPRVLDVFRRALEQTLAVFGYGPVKALLEDIRTLGTGVLPAQVLVDAGAGIDALALRIDSLTDLADADFASFRNEIAATADTVNASIAVLTPVTGALRRLAALELLEPGALEAFLREKLDAVLAVRVNETQTIEDPFERLFDGLDSALEALDLSSVSTDVSAFFERTRSAIEQIDLPDLTDRIVAATDTLAVAIAELEGAVTTVVADVEAHFDGIGGEVRALAREVGSFDEAGTFRFTFEAELAEVLAGARHAIAGNPEDPAMSSIRSRLDTLAAQVDAFAGRLESLLVPVEATITGVRDDAVAGMDAFTAFLQGLDMPALMAQLADAVEAVVDALLPIDPTALTDPVIAELEEAASALRDVDPDNLNDMLREALAMALDVVMDVDFSAEIAGPLGDAFDAARARAGAAIDELQRRYDDSLAVLDDLDPSRLLAALFEAFEVIRHKVDGLDIASLLAPLDELHQRHLREPFDALRPSTLLAPVGERYREAVAPLEEVSGAALIAPLTESLDSLKAAVTALDVSAPLREVQARIDAIHDRLAATRPSQIVAPLEAEFERLESALDRLAPGTLFGPVAALATPLTALLEDVQQEAVDTLHALYREPLEVLDDLQPTRLRAIVVEQIDTVLAALDTLAPERRIQTLKGRLFDLAAALPAADTRRRDLLDTLDFDGSMGQLARTIATLRARLIELRDGLDLSGLEALYDDVYERLEAMLPAYARTALDVETFRRLMRLADPTRFLAELDARFEALRARLVAVTPQALGEELDTVYDTLLASVSSVDPAPAIDAAIARLEQLRGVLDGVRVDFVADDLDHVLDQFRAVLAAFDVSRLAEGLDAVHDDLAEVVDQTRPSLVLAGIDASTAAVRSLVDAVDPQVVLGEPLEASWAQVNVTLEAVDLSMVLAPLLVKLDEIEADFMGALGDTETAFDSMLAAGRSALGTGGAGAGVSVGG